MTVLPVQVEVTLRSVDVARSGRVGDAARGEVLVDEGARVGDAAGEVGGHGQDIALLAVPMAAGAVVLALRNELRLKDLCLHGGNSLGCH